MNDPDVENQAEEHLPKGVYWLSLIAGLLVSVLGSKSVLQDYNTIRTQTRWNELYVPTTAKILKVGLRTESPDTKEKFYPDVLFEYFIAGQSVWGWRFSFEEEPKAHVFWEKRLQLYHVNDTITAYVNPKDAKDSFIEPKRDPLLRVYLKAMVGLGFVAAGILFCWLPAMRLFRKQN